MNYASKAVYVHDKTEEFEERVIEKITLEEGETNGEQQAKGSTCGKSSGK